MSQALTLLDRVQSEVELSKELSVTLGPLYSLLQIPWVLENEGDFSQGRNSCNSYEQPSAVTENYFSVKPLFMKCEMMSHQKEKILKRECCMRQCFNETSCEKLKVMFAGKTKLEQKNIVLNNMMMCEKVDISNSLSESDHIFIFEGHKYCLKALSELSGVSTYLLSNVRTAFNAGRRTEFEHGNIGRGRLASKSASFISWMLNFGRRYGQDSPTEKIIILPR